MHDDIKTVLLTKEEIDARVQEMGKQIAADYADKDLVVIVLLKGAAWFATDLTRAIDMPLRVDFMVASSYGNGTSTSGISIARVRSVANQAAPFSRTMTTKSLSA